MKRQYSDFSDLAKEIFDFARCQRPDGSHYPIADGLQCRKGTKAADAPIPKLVGRKKAASPTNTAARMAAAYDRLKKAKAITPSELASKNKKQEMLAAAIKKVDKKPGPKADKASTTSPPRSKSKVASKESIKEKTPEPEAKKSEPLAKPEQIKPKKEAVTSTITTSPKSSISAPEIKLDPETVEKNMARAEKQAQTDIPKIRQEMLSARKRRDENAELEAEERLGRAQEILRNIKIDREALKSGEFDKPARQFTQTQLDRIDARIKYLKENPIEGLYGSKQISPKYYDLVALRNSSNPLLLARLLGEERRMMAKYRKMEEGPELEKLRQKLNDLEARKGALSQSKEDRLKRYISSDGMIKMLKSDGDPEQNAAHKGSNRLFAEHGELGNSAMAKSLIKKYGGDEREVQRGIDAVIDFTQNSYIAIRRGVNEGDPAQTQRADRINRMVEQLSHPAVAKYRGMEVNRAVLEEFVKAADSKSTFSDKAPASWSTSAQIAADYTGKKGASVIFETNNKRGASVENWGQSGEKEILTPGGTNYRYLGYRTEVHEGKPIYVFTVEELDS